MRTTTIIIQTALEMAKKRSGLLRTVGLICPACNGSPMPHDNCTKGLCLCFRTAHQAIGQKDIAGNSELHTNPSLWCQKCDKAFWSMPVTQRCEFCGGQLSPQRNPILQVRAVRKR